MQTEVANISKLSVRKGVSIFLFIFFFCAWKVLEFCLSKVLQTMYWFFKAFFPPHIITLKYWTISNKASKQNKNSVIKLNDLLMIMFPVEKKRKRGNEATAGGRKAKTRRGKASKCCPWKRIVLVNRVNDWWELMNLMQSDIGKRRNPYSY